MQRVTKITAIQINVSTSPLGSPLSATGEAVMGTQAVSVVDSVGTTTFTSSNTIPLVPSDFTDELIASINSKISSLGLVLSRG